MWGPPRTALPTLPQLLSRRMLVECRFRASSGHPPVIPRSSCGHAAGSARGRYIRAGIFSGPLLVRHIGLSPCSWVRSYICILASGCEVIPIRQPSIHNKLFTGIPLSYTYPCRSIPEYPPGKFQCIPVGYLESFCRALVQPHYTTIFIIIYLHTTTHTQEALHRFPLHPRKGLHLHPVQNRDSRKIFFIQNPVNLESREKRAKKARTGDCRCVQPIKY